MRPVLEEEPPSVDEPVEPRAGDRDLVVPLVRGGQRCDDDSPVEALSRARTWHERLRRVMPEETWPLSRGECALETLTV